MVKLFAKNMDIPFCSFFQVIISKGRAFPDTQNYQQHCHTWTKKTHNSLPIHVFDSNSTFITHLQKNDTVDHTDEQIDPDL